MKRWLYRVLIILAGFVLLVAVAGYIALSWLTYSPDPVMPAELQCKEGAPRLAADRPLKVMSWNIQFSASRKYQFFYEGGQDVHADEADVEATLDQIIAVVRKYDPDIILWQEVDHDSARTARIDQIEALWQALPDYQCRASAPYFKSRYLPHPSHQHVGRIDMHLVVFSRFQMENATRHALPMLDENFVRRAFNLKRAVLTAELPLEGGGAMHLFNTHLSAFSRGDGTMAKQVAKFLALIQGADQAGHPWLGGGDLNLLPPGDDPKRLGASASYYADSDNPIQPLFENLTSALPVEDYHASPERYNTYIDFGESQTDRWLDHLFVSEQFAVSSYRVPQEHADISDHLPIVVELMRK